ncbi:helix-turn-helix domain-containing protein [Sorangium sp. So ce426]|uniref:helix-turn-helix domain-containing protein n=1 Tax=Sorangium sp. So ce426 TaxID=3133312 RepID=UPI003F5BCA0B
MSCQRAAPRRSAARREGQRSACDLGTEDVHPPPARLGRPRSPSRCAPSSRSPARATPGAGARTPGAPPLRRAFELIRERFVTALSLDEIALHVGLDKFQLIRALRDQLGVTPHAYVTQLRIGRARALLTRGVPPSEIAARVGLYDQSQLNRHFKRIVGITPGQLARAVG